MHASRPGVSAEERTSQTVHWSKNVNWYVSFGIPQRGPLLNDMPSIATLTQLLSFSDDTDQFVHTVMLTCFKGTWMWRIDFNTGKFAPPFSANQVAAKYIASYKDRGIVTFQDLSWPKHTHDCTIKAYKKTIPILTSIYISLIRSQTVYGSQLWRLHVFFKEIKLVESYFCLNYLPFHPIRLQLINSHQIHQQRMLLSFLFQ